MKICPVCQAPALIRDVRDMPHMYKGRRVVVPAVDAWWCSACDECVLEGREAERVSKAIMAFQRLVNADHVDPDFIASVRKKLLLDQREAARLFGGGVNAFSRYETGKTRPPESLVKLFRILDRHPELLAEVQD